MLNAQKQQKPNFVIVLADDISANTLGCYGSPNPNTSPNIDQLASEGIKFTNMFVSQAICAPARAELMTGLMPVKNGCSINHAATKKGTLSIVQHLEKLGYRVGLTGKRHFKPKSVYPYEFIDGFIQSVGFRGPAPEDWSGVKEFVTRNPNQPFCLLICSVNAHAPWDAGDSSLWNTDELILPDNLVDTDVTRKFFREYLAEVRAFDEQVGKARNLIKDNSLEKNTAMIVLDENGTGMPGGKWTTYDWGVRSACVMKWPKSFNQKLETNAIAQYCDILPTLIDAAGGNVPTNLDGKSLMPIINKQADTHREYAFFLYNSGSEGPEYASRAVTDGKFKLIWNLTPDNLYAVRVINGFDYGYVDKKMPDRDVRQIYLSWFEKAGYNETASNLVQRYKKRPEFELYNLNEDLYELNNLSNQPEYGSRITVLKKAIQDWMKQQGDDVNYQNK
ncbi:sulfatase family protein [Neotamlana sedimentorum]|uniref:sulfatase family protein n=1 Tax=Neotamlana sedimentorum TaxID=1435349 RepID=UPI0006995253|nr:sulfatase [Tamlana sedimentorum]